MSSLKNIKFTFLLFSTQLFASGYQHQIVSPKHKQETLITITDNIKRLSINRKKIVTAALIELILNVEGRDAKRRYGVNFYEWWCSEFARYVLYRSKYYGNELEKAKRIMNIGLTSQLIKFFIKEENAYYFNRFESHVKIEAGDYLAFSGPLGKATHSSIVVYVSYENNFIFTAEGNTDLNNKVNLVKRPIFIDNSLNEDFYFLGKIKEAVENER